MASSSVGGSVALGVVIGSKAHNILPAEAAGAIYGYAVGFNLVRTDHLERPTASIATSFDASSVCGRIIPACSGERSPEGNIRMSIHGKPQQRSSLKQCIWSPAEMAASLSTLFHLVPGELVFCGGLPYFLGVAVNREQTVSCGIDGLEELNFRLV